MNGEQDPDAKDSFLGALLRRGGADIVLQRGVGPDVFLPFKVRSFLPSPLAQSFDPTGTFALHPLSFYALPSRAEGRFCP